MKALFGHLCSAQIFTHDQEMTALTDEHRLARARDIARAQNSPNSTQRSAEADDATSDDQDAAISSLPVPGDFEDATSVLKKRRLSLPESKTLKGVTRPDVTQMTSDSSTSTSHNVRVQALKRSFEEMSNRQNKVKTPSADVEVTNYDEGDENDEDDYDDLSSPLGDNDLESDNQGDTQVSLPDLAFSSQHSATLREQSLASNIRQRKEAYKAAKGVNGRSWAELNPMSSSNTHTHSELEL